MTVKGFVVTDEAKNLILASANSSSEAVSISAFWTTGTFLIQSGTYAGLWFIPFTEAMINTVLINGKKPLDFASAASLIAMLGGLENRIEISASDLHGNNNDNE